MNLAVVRLPTAQSEPNMAIIGTVTSRIFPVQKCSSDTGLGLRISISFTLLFIAEL